MFNKGLSQSSKSSDIAKSINMNRLRLGGHVQGLNDEDINKISLKLYLNNRIRMQKLKWVNGRRDDVRSEELVV